MRWSLLEVAGHTEIAVWVGESAFLLRELDENLSARDVLTRSSRLYERLDYVSQRCAPIDQRQMHFLPPLLGQKILCAGLNYRDHIAETGSAAPQYPNLFIRFPDSLVGHEQALEIPDVSPELDYEVELAVVLAQPLSGRVSRDQALAAVSGYTIFNDGSLRDLQFRSSQWTLGKNVARSGAMGPWVVSADELPLGGTGLRLQTWIGENCLQDGNTSDLLFDVADLLVATVAAVPLRAGDVLATGTPAGVGFSRKPPRFLQAGESCELRIEGIGTLRNPIRHAR
ncbi:fumarylacetoacetate hydrolase family protein [Acidithiobacillus sp. AMEEHan]|uniref:fumarylacetoacetate hydrolase family protein n=1 Tax=Acidithiobacillus sp. AMEEHan TaxID=2994951 RepID=UPI0027E5271A|nr:fumarylacetoacetate hydrolase family protein [Acidithiobacillus sp. AMEEHan]